MNIKFIENKKIEIEMKNRLKEDFGMFVDEIFESPPSTPEKHLLLEDEGALPLDEEYR